MMKRVLVVGGVAGGASAAARVRRLDESASITIFERGPHVSFSNCALPYYLSGVVASSERLLMMNPEKFKSNYNIDVRVESEVVSIDRAAKTVTVENKADGTTYTEGYDVLVLSPGASPIVPRSITGTDGEQVFTVRNVVDITAIKSYIDTHGVENVAVVGGGFIGLEVAENLVHAGKHVTLVEAADQIMAPFDYDMVQMLHKELCDNGVELIVSDGLKTIEPDKITLSSGRTVPAGAVVLAIGVAPEIKLAKEAGLEIGTTGGIRVNQHYQTSDPSIYAVGDAIEVFHSLTHTPTRLALAGPAQRQARAAAEHICGLASSNKGVIGSSVVRVFNLNAACTGLSEKAARAAGIPCDFAYVIPGDKPGMMPGSAPMHFKLVYEVPTGRILGAQAIGKGDVVARVNTVAAMITMGADLEDLKELELCYSPLFGTAKDVVNFAAMVGLNTLYGMVKQVPVTAVRDLVEQKATIVDVREVPEYEAGHIVGAVNVPLSQLRQRMEEIPKDRPVYLHCRTSQRSYNAARALLGAGWTDVYNISGSFLGLSLYEWYNDQTTGREKIVTEYNFR